MSQPFWENTAKNLRYLLLGLAFVSAQSLALYPALALPAWITIAYSCLQGLIYALLGLLLWKVIRYGNFAVLSIFQRSANYVALSLLSVALWLGGAYGCFWLLFGAETATRLHPMLPSQAFTGLLIYGLFILWFRLKSGNVEESDTEQAEEPLPAEEAQSDKTPAPGLLERIALKSGSKIHVVLVPDIVYLQADGDYVQIFTAEGKFLKEQTMKYFEEHLPREQFVRVHRSTIVNVSMISRIELYEKQNQLLTLKNGHQIKTSPAGYKALRATLNL